MKKNIYFRGLFISIILSANSSWCENFNINTLELRNILDKNIKLDTRGKMLIPDHIKHIKLDIGLSYSAPMSQYWLTHENDLIVFGFEPNPDNVNSIINGAIKRDRSHGEPLETKFVGKNFFLIPCALGVSESTTIKFNVTKDCGCSSIYMPKFFEMEKVIEVPIFSLEKFFEIFPLDTHPVIDYIKIDTQGSDLDIVKSGGKYIADHVIYITIEAENSQYEGTTNSEQEIDKYMNSIGFKRYKSSYTSDPTYFNLKFSEYIKNNNIQIYQKG